MPNDSRGPLCGHQLGEDWIDKGTFALTRSRSNSIVGICPPESRIHNKLCFAIYITSSDDAFFRAANTWLNEHKPITGFLEMALHSKHLSQIFRTLKERAQSLRAEYIAGSIFSHSTSPQEKNDKTNGLQIAPYDGHHLRTIAELRVREAMKKEYRDSGNSPFAVNSSIISGLPILPWSVGGTLEIFGCNSGLGDPSLAALFAKSQKVKTIGQGGFASFSKNKEKYEEIDKETKDIYLRAFFDRSNYAAAVGIHKVFVPNEAPPLGVNRLIGLPNSAIPEIVELP